MQTFTMSSQSAALHSKRAVGLALKSSLVLVLRWLMRLKAEWSNFNEFQRSGLLLFLILGNTAWWDVAQNQGDKKNTNEKDFLGHLHRSVDLLHVIGVRLTQIWPDLIHNIIEGTNTKAHYKKRPAFSGVWQKGKVFKNQCNIICHLQLY